MTKEKLVSFRCDEALYNELAATAEQREMKVGELAREMVRACVTGKSEIEARPWVKRLEVLWDELDMDVCALQDVVEVRHEELTNRLKFNEEMMTALLRGTVQSLSVMRHLARHADPALLRGTFGTGV